MSSVKTILKVTTEKRKNEGFEMDCYKLMIMISCWKNGVTSNNEVQERMLKIKLLWNSLVNINDHKWIIYLIFVLKLILTNVK